MEKSFADLLNDAFSGTAAFPDEGLEFESLGFDEKLGEDKTCTSQENIRGKENKALYQEVTNQPADVSDTEAKNACAAQHVDKDLPDEEYFRGLGVMRKEREDYTSLDGDPEQEGSVPGEEEEQEEEEDDDEEEEEEEEKEEDRVAGGQTGELLMSLWCGSEFCSGNKEDRTFAEGQPLALEGAENPQVRNEEQGDSDEDLSYFERVPEHGSGMRIKGDGSEEGEQEWGEEKQEDSPDSESEDMKTEEGNALARYFEQEEENAGIDRPMDVNLEFPGTGLSSQNLQDLNADGGGVVEKLRDFLGEEHQEAGESFADYPSDFSSCEYEESGGKSPKSNPDVWVARGGNDSGWEARAEGADDEERVECMFGLDIERVGDVVTEEEGKDGGETGLEEHTLDDAAVVRCETDDSDSDTSSEDEAVPDRSDEELFEIEHPYNAENSKQLEELARGSGETFARWSTCDDYGSAADPAGFNLNWNPDVLRAQTFLTDSLLTAEDPVTGATKGTTCFSDRGSLDDGFFFNTEPENCRSTEVVELEEEEYEEERNWEQEQERIKAFFEYYDDSDSEKGNEERQTKVQFRTESLSQVIHYETNSDEDLLSTSTEGEEDPSSTETSEDLKECEHSTEVKPACDPPNIQPAETECDVHKTQTCARKRQCLNVLRATLKTAALTMMGVLMFWLADQSGWLSEVSFF